MELQRSVSPPVGAAVTTGATAPTKPTASDPDFAPAIFEAIREERALRAGSLLLAAVRSGSRARVDKRTALAVLDALIDERDPRANGLLGEVAAYVVAHNLLDRTERSRYFARCNQRGKVEAAVLFI